jgi:hypothetical protein
MFQAVTPPIIWSSILYIQHRVIAKTLLLPAAIVKELEMISNSSTIAAGSSKVLTNIRCCIYSFELLMMGGVTA